MTVVKIDRWRDQKARAAQAEDLHRDIASARFLLEYFTRQVPVDLQAFTRLWRRIAARGGRWKPSDKHELARLFTDAREPRQPFDGPGMQFELDLQPDPIFDQEIKR